MHPCVLIEIKITKREQQKKTPDEVRAWLNNPCDKGIRHTLAYGRLTNVHNV
jgi:hypothetical protein